MTTGLLFQTPNFGPDYKAQATLAYIRDICPDIQSSWDERTKRYTAEPRIAEWHNGRETGFVIWLRGISRTIAIAFFEHRNSDRIHAVEFYLGSCFAPPTIRDISADHPYAESKLATQFDVRHDQAYVMAEWIAAKINQFWLAEGILINGGNANSEDRLWAGAMAEALTERKG